jgi:hypothetical protein
MAPTQMTPTTPVNQSNDTALVRGVRTIFQTIIGAFVGLIVAVWAVPGVPETVTHYISSNMVQLLLVVGIPSGVASFIWNLLRPSVKNV